jgi:hypothetical protein
MVTFGLFAMLFLYALDGWCNERAMRDAPWNRRAEPKKKEEK